MNDSLLVIRKRARLANESVMSNISEIIYFYFHISQIMYDLLESEEKLQSKL